MRYRRIVIGVDFSTASLNAVRWVSTQMAPHAELHLAHVVSRPRMPSFLSSHGHLLDEQNAEEPTLYPGLAGFAGLAGARRAEVTVRRGQPADELAALAREVDADLICVGRSQRRRGTGRFGATTPQRLLARTKVSVLLVPHAPPHRVTRLLAAVSDGAEAQNVLQIAGMLADEWDARVDVLHALDPDTVVPSMSAPTLMRLTDAWLADRSAAMPRLKKRSNALGRIGDAAEAILTHASAAESGLIVMGRRAVVEHGDENEGCVGSTTRLITWTTPCPVLVVGRRSPDQPPHEQGAFRRAELWNQTRTASGRRTGRRRSDAVVPPTGDDAA